MSALSPAMGLRLLHIMEITCSGTRFREQVCFGAS